MEEGSYESKNEETLEADNGKDKGVLEAYIPLRRQTGYIYLDFRPV